MDYMETIADLARRVAKLEANRGASLRFATVTESNVVGSARVQLHDGDEMVSYPVRTLHKRTLKDKDQTLPDVGEQVAVLFAGQGLEEGCILGATYSEKDQSPGAEQPVAHYQFEDGSTFFYDRVNHKLYALIKGEAEITIEKKTHVTVKDKATVVVHDNASIRSHKHLHLQGDEGITMKGPSIDWDDLEGTGSCDVTIRAKIHHVGPMKHDGDTAQEGSQTTSGSLSAGGNIHSKADVIADGKVVGNPVIGCPH